MRTLSFLLLAAVMPAQSWHISYPAAFKQPNGSGGVFHGQNMTTIPANPGEVALVYGGVTTNVGSIQCYGFRSTPTPVGGGLYDVAYEEGDFVPLLMLAPHDIGYSSQVSGAVSGWDYLFCDPATLSSQLVYSEPWVAYNLAVYSGWVTGYPNHFEWFDDFMYPLPDPGTPALLGLEFTAQWAISHPQDGIKLSSAAKLWVQ